MAKNARRRARKTGVEIDFTGVEAGGGGGFHIKEGSYLMKVIEVEDTESDKGNQMFKWTFEGQEKAAKGKKFYLYTVYDPPDSLWKLRSLLEALGQEVPDGPMDLDVSELVDLELVGHVEDEEYEGKTRSRMNDFSSVDGEEAEEKEEEEEEEEKPARGKKGAAKKTAKKDKKELEAISADEVKAMDDDEMAELIEKYELDVVLDDHKTPRRKASAITAALEEKDLLSDD